MKINRKQAKDYISENICNEIMVGGIEDGEELVQEQIAEMTGVSRMPVREALQQLERIGMARRLSNRHIVAVVPNKRSITATFRMLAIIETELFSQSLDDDVDISEWLNALCKLKDNPNCKDEIRMHTILPNLLDIYPLEDSHQQLFKGYAAYAIRTCQRTPNEICAQVKEIETAVLKKSVSVMKVAMQSYYSELAKTLIRSGNYE